MPLYPPLPFIRGITDVTYLLGYLQENPRLEQAGDDTLLSIRLLFYIELDIHTTKWNCFTQKQHFSLFTIDSITAPIYHATMPRDPLIGLVGKPSSGKSTTLNRYTFHSILQFPSPLTTAPSKASPTQPPKSVSQAPLFPDTQHLSSPPTHLQETSRTHNPTQPPHHLPLNSHHPKLHNHRPPTRNRLPPNPLRLRPLLPAIEVRTQPRLLHLRTQKRTYRAAGCGWTCAGGAFGEGAWEQVSG